MVLRSVWILPAFPGPIWCVCGLSGLVPLSVSVSRCILGFHLHCSTLNKSLSVYGHYLFLCTYWSLWAWQGMKMVYFFSFSLFYFFRFRPQTSHHTMHWCNLWMEEAWQFVWERDTDMIERITSSYFFLQLRKKYAFKSISTFWFLYFYVLLGVICENFPSGLEVFESLYFLVRCFFFFLIENYRNTPDSFRSVMTSFLCKMAP